MFDRLRLKTRQFGNINRNAVEFTNEIFIHVARVVDVDVDVRPEQERL